MSDKNEISIGYDLSVNIPPFLYLSLSRTLAPLSSLLIVCPLARLHLCLIKPIFRTSRLEQEVV